ncbi:MAG: methyl-accepting chemotaxis protein [Pseudomonadota bacterium]
MALPLDWRKDPIVIIEHVLVPLIARVPAALCERALGQEGAQGSADLVADMQEAAALLEGGFADVLGPAGFALEPEAAEISVRAGRHWRALAAQLPDGDPAALLQLFQNDVYPATAEALDGVRGSFISAVLQRQAHHAALSGAMMEELSRLSRAIQFVAINASIEAARSGKAGRAFSLIATEIRDLAKKARGVIEDRPS